MKTSRFSEQQIAFILKQADDGTSVDEDYRPGRFLLTGSANVMTLPRIADSLGGRMEIIQMLPLARAEIERRAPTFLERLFESGLRSQRSAMLGEDLIGLVLQGGFPEAISREKERRPRGSRSRSSWARCTTCRAPSSPRLPGRSTG